MFVLLRRRGPHHFNEKRVLYCCLRQMLVLCNKSSKTKYVSRKPEQSGNIREFMWDKTARWKSHTLIIKSPHVWAMRAGEEFGYLGNWRGRDLIKSITSLKRDSLPLVTVLMAFQTGEIRFVLSIADWSLVQWDLFDVKNKGFLLGYTGQDWWCVKSRPQRGKQRKTLSSSHGKITFSPETFCKSSLENRLSRNAGEPSHKTELQRTQRFWVFCFWQSKDIGGSVLSCKSPDMRRSLPEQIKIPVYHFREKIGAIFDSEGRLIWALWLLLSLSLVCHLLPLFPSLPFSSLGIDVLTDGHRTSGLRTGEGGRSAENRGKEGEEGEEGEKGGFGRRVARREGITTVFARYKAFGCWIPGMGGWWSGAGRRGLRGWRGAG